MRSPFSRVAAAVLVLAIVGVALWFHGVGSTPAFADYIKTISHIVSFVLLAAIGINMIREALTKKDKDDEPDAECSLSVKAMFLMAVATSIDALAVGVTLAFLNVNIAAACSLIGVTTFLISLGGVAVGNFFGARFQKKAEIAGGVILILIGVKILLEHLGML